MFLINAAEASNLGLPIRRLSIAGNCISIQGRNILADFRLGISKIHSQWNE